MSDTEIGIIPEPHSFCASDNGLTRWRPVLDSISVVRLAGGRRLLQVSLGDNEPIRFSLSAEQALHLANLLAGTPAPSTPTNTAAESASV